jgi:hypothetical protein
MPVHAGKWGYDQKGKQQEECYPVWYRHTEKIIQSSKSEAKRQYQENCSDYHDCLLLLLFKAAIL